MDEITRLSTKKGDKVLGADFFKSGSVVVWLWSGDEKKILQMVNIYVADDGLLHVFSNSKVKQQVIGVQK